MKKIFIIALIMTTALTSAWGQQSPLWLRYPSISPDGKQVAFSYKGDIYVVDGVNGGCARQLTTNSAYDSAPVWSPDGERIAFASAREGSLDIYVVGRNGGVPTRLTTNSGDEVPMTFSADGKKVLFQASLRPTAQSIIFASREFPQVYEVDVDGKSRPRLFSALTMCDMSISSDGAILYHDQKGYEDPFRKHHTSSITRDIWMLRNGEYTKMTTSPAEDRTPVWAADGKSFYYLSEQDGSFNIYKKVVGANGSTRLTDHKMHPVRFLSSSRDGLLCYAYDGEIYTVREGQQPKKLNISIVTDQQDRNLVRQLRRSGATEICVAPSGKEVAFVMHGDVFVTDTDYKTTRRITDTPEQERSVDFAPDGRSLVYAAERNGLWQIFISTIKNKEEKQFAYATEITETQLVKSDVTSFQPKFSPDGKKVAFIEDRAALRVIDVKSHEVRTVLDGKYNFSYSDGDEWFEWSPDSRYLLSSYIGTGGWNNADIALVPADGSMRIVNLTESGYNEGAGKWVLGGKAMLFESDRAGYRSHGSWGAESDWYVMFFDQEAYDYFQLSKEEKELLKDSKKNDSEKKDDKDSKDSKKQKNAKKGNGKNTNDKSAEKKEPFHLDFDAMAATGALDGGFRNRVVRLTNHSAHMGDAILSVTGDTLYYQASFEDGMDLWRIDRKEDKIEKVLKGIGRGQMQVDKDQKNIYLLGGREIKKVDFAKATSKAVDYEADFNYRPAEEREYIFNHVWRQVKDKFYVEDIHGVDWEAYGEAYKKFLPYVNNGYDFRDMLSEMLGELNGSHTGARYYPEGASMKTATLGLFYDEEYVGEGLKISEVIARGPFTKGKNSVKAGDIIMAIDGHSIAAGEDYNVLLDGKAGKRVRCTVKNHATGKSTDVYVKAISLGAERELLYLRWVDRNRHLVDSLSGGKLAYVHVKAMNSESFRTVYRELLSDTNRNRQAVIVDERHNGGGWLHDDLCTLLSGKEYQQFVPHGKYVGSDPFNKWTKPSCVLVCEDDYSNGHGFPWVYKTLGIGKLIGTPVPGTMTAVWWETLIDGSVFGIPQVGCRSMDGIYGENTQLYPDIEVYNTPADYLSGHDTQLEKAVKEMMKL